MLTTMKPNTQSALLCHTNDRQSNATATSLQKHDPPHQKRTTNDANDEVKHSLGSSVSYSPANDRQNKAIAASLKQHDPPHHFFHPKTWLSYMSKQSTGINYDDHEAFRCPTTQFPVTPSLINTSPMHKTIRPLQWSMSLQQVNIPPNMETCRRTSSVMCLTL